MLGWFLLCLFILPMIIFLFLVPRVMRDDMWADSGVQLIAAYALLGVALLLFWEATNTVHFEDQAGLSLAAWFRWGGLAAIVAAIIAFVREPRSKR